MWAEPFELRYVARGRWQVLGGLVFHDPMHGLLQVPAGAETDLATVRPLRTAALAGLVLGALLALLAGLASPLASTLLALALAAHALGALALLLYATVVGYGDRAAALHDWLYRARIMPRAPADAVFRRALRADGIARWRAALMWAGVRVGGGWAWRRARRR